MSNGFSLNNPFIQTSRRKRSLSSREKQILYMTAKGHCQNPHCKKKIDQSEMQIGHKTAFSRGGATTLKNAVCLCWRCNKLQGTDSWEKFLKKQGIAKDQGKPRARKKSSEKKPRREQGIADILGGFNDFKRSNWGI